MTVEGLRRLNRLLTEQANLSREFITHGFEMADDLAESEDPEVATYVAALRGMLHTEAKLMQRRIAVAEHGRKLLERCEGAGG